MSKFSVMLLSIFVGTLLALGIREYIEQAHAQEATHSFKVDSTTVSVIAPGKVIYQSNCTYCHSYNPAVDGRIGPSVSGSSKALLSKKLHDATYPKGYTPKRTTMLMPTFPQLKDEEIEALYLYLNQRN